MKILNSQNPMKNKKNLHIIYLDFDDIKNPLLGGGQAISTREIGSRLAKKGHYLTSLCSRYPGYKDRKENGILYKHIGLGSKFIRLNNFVYILLIPFYVMKLKADIIIECFTAPISTLFSPLFTKVPVVAFPSVFAAEQFSRKYHLPLYLIERFGCKFYKYFLPYTSDIDRRMKLLNPTIHSKIVPHGISPEYFNVKLKKPKHILFLGRFDMDQKGIDLLLQAYKKISEKIALPLFLAGRGPDEGKMRELITKLGIEEKVKIVGPAFGQKKLELMSEALFVAFSSRHDDMSIWALESLAAGLPIVMFDQKEFFWANESFSYKAKSFSIDSYAEKLWTAATDFQLNKKRVAGKDYAKQFTWDKVADEFESFFNEVQQMEQKYEK